MAKMHSEYLKPIVVKTPLGYDYFDYDEIVLIEALGNCSKIHALNRSNPVRVLHNLAFFERKYCDTKFYRCHKSFIINLIHIETLVFKTHEIQLRMNLTAPLSERCLKYIRQQTSNLL